MSLPRAIFLLLLAYVGLVTATALAALSLRPLPDVGFLIALYAGLHCRPFASSGGNTSALLSLHNARPESMAGFGAALGYLSDVVSGTPLGLHALGLAVSVLLLRAVSIRLLVRGVGAVMLVSLLSLLFYRLLLSLLFVLFAALFSPAGSTLWAAPELGSLIGEATVTAALAPLVFAVLARLDQSVWGDPRTQGLGGGLGGGIDGNSRRSRRAQSGGPARLSADLPSGAGGAGGRR